MQPSSSQQQLMYQLKNERNRLQDLVWELDDIEVALAELEAQYATTKDLDAASRHELEHLRERYDIMEEIVLQQMLYIDRLQDRVDTLPYPAVRAA